MWSNVVPVEGGVRHSVNPAAASRSLIDLGCVGGEVRVCSQQYLDWGEVLLYVRWHGGTRVAIRGIDGNDMSHPRLDMRGISSLTGAIHRKLTPYIRLSILRSNASIFSFWIFSLFGKNTWRTTTASASDLQRHNISKFIRTARNLGDRAAAIAIAKTRPIVKLELLS